jgi:hypothetical protein
LTPERVNAPVPAFAKTPEPEISAVIEESLALLTVPVTAPLMMTFRSNPTIPELKTSDEVPVNVTLPAPIPLAAPIETAPAPIWVPPEWVFTPDSVRVPPPALARVPDPEITDVIDELALLLTVPVIPASIAIARLNPVMPLLKIRDELPVNVTVPVPIPLAAPIETAPPPICVPPE